jgi:hypothetical protein
MSILRDPGGTPTTSAGIGPISPRPVSLYHTPRGPKGRGGTVKRLAIMVFAGILASSLLPSMTYYVLEVRGGSQQGNRRAGAYGLTLFHRYPDGAI